MSETVTNPAYPWISFETSPGYAHPQSQVRRCAHCGAEERAKPLTGSHGSRYFPGTVAWIEAHFRCKASPLGHSETGPEEYPPLDYHARDEG